MAQRPTILVVDDEPELRRLLTEFLEARGYDVITASNGVEAVAAVRERRPSLVLLDLLMPGMDGLGALQEIKKVDGRIGIVMLTGVHDESSAREAIRRSAYDYVTKPIDFDYLELTILTKLAQIEPAENAGRGPAVPHNHGHV